MSWKSVLGKTLLGAGILFATVIYMSFDVPADGRLDIRESILSLFGLIVGFWILGETWGRLLWKGLRILAKDVGVFAETVFAETVFVHVSDHFPKKSKRKKNR